MYINLVSNFGIDTPPTAVPPLSKCDNMEKKIKSRGATYRLLGKSEETLGFGARLFFGGRAFFETLITLGFLLLDGRCRADWNSLWTGKKVTVFYASDFYSCNKFLADEGDTKAQYLMGYIYETGHTVDQSFQQAIKYYELAADKGNKAAQYRLLNLYNSWSIGAPSHEKAFKYCKLIADQGDARAQYEVAIDYAEGNLLSKVARSYEEALKYARLAARQNHKLAIELLAEMYKSGKGVPQSDERAAHYKELAKSIPLSARKWKIDKSDGLELGGKSWEEFVRETLSGEGIDLPQSL